MTKIAITGARGFLGLHTQAAAKEFGIETVPVPLGDHFDQTQALQAIRGADKVLHLAGVNRGSEAEVSSGNRLFAEQLGDLLVRSEHPPAAVIYANSIQSGNGTVYGSSKEHAGEILRDLAEKCGSSFENVRLPNLFGEYGKPFYNSVVATFSHLLASGQTPQIDEDKDLHLLHAQNAAELLLGKAPLANISQLIHVESVSGVKKLLQEFQQYYSCGEFPDLSTTFRRDLFNTYRSYTFPQDAPIDITRHADHRGAFFEIVRSRGGTAQTSFSTTEPGITRGEHYHRRKVERFTVLAGEAEINLRRLYDEKVFTYKISGEEPKSVDMPTLYSHNIRNVGSETLYTAFWTNDIFDPNKPDTIAEDV